ncbi:MAG: macrolide transport system ATP-binding/permease protein [Pseudonocardiales bacterium]|jgi:putative ABC transport system ATP-binding protein|nr:macrolide transport system ATP-binding/permease protein [Pseudonocardiales bacterium]
MTDVVVRLRGVERHYPPDCRALQGVDLDLRRGEFAALVGRSGSGKSTLLNIIGLLDRATAGEYELVGERVGSFGSARRSQLRARYLGFVFQAFHLLDTRTVVENVELGAVYLGWPVSRRRARALELLEQVGVADKSSNVVRTLSGGERQRVAIARALMGDPHLVLCDEPTGNLDTANAAAVMSVLRGLGPAGVTVLLVTHDRELADQADRILRVTDGRLA